MPIRKTKTTQKKPRQKDVVYPILKECAIIVKDKFWKQFYEDLACGKSTKGIYIGNGIIQSSNKRNGFNYSITDKAPEIIVKELHHLLTTLTNICSKKDLTQKRGIIKELEEELNNYDKSEWTAIKRKNIRNMLIINYAILLHKKYNLTWEFTTHAYRVILNAFENKTHTSKDVVYKRGKIQNIKDIEYDESGKIVNTRKIEKFDNQEQNQCENKSIMLQNLFDNYVNAWIKYTKG